MRFWTGIWTRLSRGSWCLGRESSGVRRRANLGAQKLRNATPNASAANLQALANPKIARLKTTSRAAPANPISPAVSRKPACFFKRRAAAFTHRPPLIAANPRRHFYAPSPLHWDAANPRHSARRALSRTRESAPSLTPPRACRLPQTSSIPARARRKGCARSRDSHRFCPR